MSQRNITIDPDRIADFCRAHRVASLSLFGSVLRNDFHDGSDVDVLAEFEPDSHVSLFDMMHLEDELEEMLGRKVDLRTPEELSDYFRDRVMATAEVQYLRG